MGYEFWSKRPLKQSGLGFGRKVKTQTHRLERCQARTEERFDYVQDYFDGEELNEYLVKKRKEEEHGW